MNDLQTITATLLLALAMTLPAAPAHAADADRYPVAIDGLYGYIDASGAVVIQPAWLEAQGFREGYAGVRNEQGWFFIDPAGNALPGGPYEAASAFLEGLAAIRQGGLVGFIDTAGKVVIEPRWVGAENFSDGLSLVREGDHFGFIDKTGTLVIAANLPWADSFSEGLAPVSKTGQLAGFMDKTGALVVPESYTQVGLFAEGRAAVTHGSGSGYFFIDPKGEKIIEGSWDGATDFSEGVAVVKKDDLYGVIGLDGATVVEPTYPVMGSAMNGRIAFSKDGLIGFMDLTGKVVIEPTYADTLSFEGALASVRQDMRWGFIDKSGVMVWQQPESTTEADRTHFESLVGQAVASAYYPFMVDGEVLLGEFIGAYPDEQSAVAAARVHTEWEILIPHKSGEQWVWGAFVGDRDYLLRELTISPKDGFPVVVAVEVDTTAEGQFRISRDATAACRFTDTSIRAYLAADSTQSANVPQVRRYGSEPDGLTLGPLTRMVHE